MVFNIFKICKFKSLSLKFYLFENIKQICLIFYGTIKYDRLKSLNTILLFDVISNLLTYNIMLNIKCIVLKRIIFRIINTLVIMTNGLENVN